MWLQSLELKIPFLEDMEVKTHLWHSHDIDKNETRAQAQENSLIDENKKLIQLNRLIFALL